MKVYILFWNSEYVLGVFATQLKAEKAQKHYSENPILGQENDYPFEIKEFIYDKVGDSMLTEIEEDGWFEDIEEDEDDVSEKNEGTTDNKPTKPSKFKFALIVFFELFKLACLIWGFISIVKAIWNAIF